MRNHCVYDLSMTWTSLLRDIFRPNALVVSSSEIPSVLNIRIESDFFLLNEQQFHSAIFRHYMFTCLNDKGGVA